MVRIIKKDFYLQKFVDFCKKKYDKNLLAIGIYGSYAWGYFDKQKSDYDIFLIFNSKTRSERGFLMKKFPKIAVHYFCSLDQLSILFKKGHWSPYITFLTSARMLSSRIEYGKFIKKMKKINFLDYFENTKRIKWKFQFDKDVIRKTKGYKCIKYALPTLRVRLQFLTYIKTKKLIWNLSKNINLNKDFLDVDEKRFLLSLDNKVKKREKKFSVFDKKRTINLLNKIYKEIMNSLETA